MKFVREHAVAIFLSVLVHGALLALLVYGFLNYRESSRPTPQPQLAIEAEVVDEELITEEMRRIEEAEAQKLREEQERAEQLRREREAEEQKLEEAKRLRAEEEEAQRLLAEQRQREEAERAAAEAKRQEEQEAKAAAERRRKDEAARKKAAQEARLKAEREAELKRQLAEEERRQQAVESGLLQQYVAQIQARIQRAWIRPPNAKAGLRCVVYVTQVPGGEVASVRVGECNGDDIVRQSIEAAVYRASPLPEPPDPALFERNLKLEFAPQE